MRSQHLRAWGESGATRVQVVAVGAAVVIALLVGGALRYQPLAQAGDLETGGDMQVVTVEEFDGVGAHILRYMDGEYVSYAFTVRNTGPVGITVTGIGLPEERERLLLQPVTAGLAGDQSAEVADMESFEPFALPAGAQRRLVIQARFDNCEYYSERAVDNIDSQVLQFRIAGIPRTAAIPFERDLVVRSPTINRCEDRTLDRSDHLRSDP